MKKIFITLAVGLFFALIALGLISCGGARKVNKESSKEETKIETVDNSIAEKQIDTNVKTSVETKTDDKNESVTQEIIFEPIDSSKESFVIEKDGTKVIFSNAKKIVRNTVQKNNIQSESKSNTEEVKKEAEKEQKAVKKAEEAKKENRSKEVDKKQFNPINYYIGFAIFIIIMVIAYLVLKRLKLI